jgi:mRNA interferase RelE/StbE
MYRIDYRPSAEQYFKKLKEKPLKRRFFNEIKEIRKDPYSGEPKTGDLAGVYCRDFTYRGTTYEIAYSIHEDPDGNVVIVILAGTRENFYKELKRLFR